MIRLCALLVTLILAIPQASAKDLTYHLKPQKITDDVYVFIGSTEHFNRENGGNIVNTGFIIGDSGVIVIDTGPSTRYGQEMRKAILSITTKPVTHVLITHHHPDHFLGTQAFSDAEVLALPETIKAMQTEGEGLLENMFRMVGDWMIGTELALPTKAVSVSRTSLAGRDLQFYPLHGHTDGDLAILDVKSGVLFAGDIAFHNRTPTTPHAVIDEWLSSLDTLASVKFKTLVPGHGPIEHDGSSLAQTRDYLIWLKGALAKAAADGLDMMEVMRLEKPERFKALSVDQVEFQRSVAHLWPHLVESTLPKLDTEIE